MSDYAEAVADYREVDRALADAYRPEPVLLPAVAAAPVVVRQPTLLPEPRRGLDPLSVRLLSGGGAVCLCGLGVDLAGQGVRVAGPYLWGLAAVLGALGALIALIKSKTAPSPSGPTVTISGGKNKIGSIG